MSRYIDADALLEFVGRWRLDSREMIADLIKAQPTADVRENVHGEWVGTEYDGYADGHPVFYEWECSACGCIVEDEEPTWNYCPNCGADMRGEG